MMNIQEFINYMMSFYGPAGIYSELNFNEIQVATALGVYRGRLHQQGSEFVGDSVDREAVRDIILAARGNTVPEFLHVRDMIRAANQRTVH